MSGPVADGNRKPKLVVFAGLPGAGKSTLARLLAENLPAVWLRVDTIEASVLKAGIPRSFETGLAAYLVARDIAREHLRLRRDVVIDAVNGVEPARAMWRQLAEECETERFVIEVKCSDLAEHRRRVESRNLATPPLPSPTWEEVLQREYEAWNEPILTVDGADSPSKNLPLVRDHIRR